MKKVLWIVFTLDVGGIESLCVNLFKCMNREKYKVDFVVFKDPETTQFYDKTIENLGGRIVPVGKCKSNKLVKYITCQRDIYNLIKKEKYDIVHIHSGHIHTLPELMIAKKLGVHKVIAHSHNGKLARSASMYNVRCLLQRVYRRLVPHYADVLMSCSDLASEWSFPEKYIKQGKVIQFNNGVIVSDYVFDCEKRRSFREKLNLKEDAFLIGHIGRMNVQKNHKFLIEVFKEVIKKKPNSYLLLCGIGDEEKNIRKMVDSYGLNDHVIFYGVTNRVDQVLSAIDVFVFPSLFEGLPVVGIEAQASGVPIVAADTITKKVALTPCWHSLSLESPISEWVDLILQQAGKERINTEDILKESGFDIRTVASQLESIYG